jgi:hypothetical protein
MPPVQSPTRSRRPLVIAAPVVVLTLALLLAVIAVATGSGAPRSGRPAATDVALARPVQVVPSPTLPATLTLPAARWTTSFDADLGHSGTLRVDAGGRRFELRTVTSGIALVTGPRTRSTLPSAGWGPTGWHHVEIGGGATGIVIAVDGVRQTLTQLGLAPRSRASPAPSGALGLTAGSGVRVRALIVAAASDSTGLLIQRLAELHARLHPGQYVFGATARDALELQFSWTNGFYAGALWQAAALQPAGGMFRSWALAATLQHLGHELTPTHDVGFMYGESSLAGWRALCQANRAARVPAASTALCARLRASVLAAAGELVRLAATNPGSGTIPTSPSSPLGETIIDSMVNVQILPWATAQTGNPVYARLARHQAEVIAHYLIRRDGSTYQAVHFDRRTGRVAFLGTHQGRSNTSTWSRGEGWAIYGFAGLAQQLHSAADLRIALRAAAYVAAHLPRSGVPRWDYDAPAGAPVDVSAGVITAAGLLHLVAACRAIQHVCPDPGRWTALAARMTDGALAIASTRPPVGYLGSQVTDERIPHCACNGGELIYGLTYALEALAEQSAADPGPGIGLRVDTTLGDLGRTIDTAVRGTYGLAGIGTFGHGSWSWFGDPRAVALTLPRPITFVGWIGWHGQITIGAYRRDLGTVTEHVIGSLFHDDHSAPSILVEPDERLTVFWSAHNGTALYYRTTTGAEEISSWGPLHQLPSNVAGRYGYTYPNPVLLPAEHDRLYLFFRGGDWSEDYATRLPGGAWTHARQLIAQTGERPYVKVTSDGVGRVGFAFTNGHPRNVLTSVYYAEYDRGALYGAGGRRIQRLAHGPIAPRQADVVYNAHHTGVPAWVWDVAVDGGHPVILYATFPSARDHVYWYARWNGRAWTRHLLIHAGPTIAPRTIEFEYSPGMTLDHADPSVVYLSRQVRGGWDIERWVTPDGGRHWTHSVVVPSDGTENIRPVVPRGSTGGPVSLLWLRGPYNDYTTYRTSIAYLR